MIQGKKVAGLISIFENATQPTREAQEYMPHTVPTRSIEHSMHCEKESNVRPAASNRKVVFDPIPIVHNIPNSNSDDED